MEGLNRMFRGQGMAGVGSAPPGAVRRNMLPHERYDDEFHGCDGDSSYSSGYYC